MARALHTHEPMTRTFQLASVLVMTALAATSVGACGDDDDNGSESRGGATSAGTGSGGGGRTGSDASGAAQTGDAGTPERGGAPGSTDNQESGTGGVASGAVAGSDAGGAGGAAAVDLSDAQILLVLDTLNQGEVEEGFAVLPRLTVADVKAFAQRMVTDHSQGRQAVAEAADSLGLAPAPSSTQLALKMEGETHVEELRATPSSSLDSVYVNHEVVAHQEALALLAELNTAADAAALKTLIGALTATVQEHLDAGTALAADL
jgi:putative membrane protein